MEASAKTETEEKFFFALAAIAAKIVIKKAVVWGVKKAVRYGTKKLVKYAAKKALRAGIKYGKR